MKLPMQDARVETGIAEPRSQPPDPGHPVSDRRESEAGFLLLFLIVAIFLVTLTLAIAAPRIARSIQRDREQETRQRAGQYTRAIQLYYRKNKNYPASMEALKKSNNIRYLRQEYIDPMTGKNDWKLIHVGENKTTVKGFFGEDLPGIAGASGLSSIGGSSPAAGSGGSAASTSAFNNSGSNSQSGNSFGSSSTPTGGPGISSQDATTAKGSGGAFMGVAIPKDGESLLTVDEKSNYEDWEFLYDPRIEQLKAKASLLGGINSGSGTAPSGSTPIGGANPIGGTGQGISAPQGTPQ